MTREEACKIMRDAVAAQGDGGSGSAGIIDGLVALGVLKLEEKREQKASDWREPIARCEPPPEHQDKRWHWLRVQAGQLAVVEWEPKSIALNWTRIDPAGGPGDTIESFSAKRAWDEGWRYVAPCLSPEVRPDYWLSGERKITEEMVRCGATAVGELIDMSPSMNEIVAERVLCAALKPQGVFFKHGTCDCIDWDRCSRLMDCLRARERAALGKESW